MLSTRHLVRWAPRLLRIYAGRIVVWPGLPGRLPREPPHSATTCLTNELFPAPPQQAYFGAAPISAPFGDTYGTTGKLQAAHSHAAQFTAASHYTLAWETTRLHTRSCYCYRCHVAPL